MATMTENSTEKRLVDLRSEVHRGFGQVDRRFDRIEGDIRELRSDVKAGSDGLRTELKTGDDAGAGGVRIMSMLVHKWISCRFRT